MKILAFAMCTLCGARPNRATHAWCEECHAENMRDYRKRVRRAREFLEVQLEDANDEINDLKSDRLPPAVERLTGQPGVATVGRSPIPRSPHDEEISSHRRT